jgi:ADP-heptose:LPS heptosyltransferase
MFRHLQIAEPVERWLVGSADAALTMLTVPGRILRAVPRDPIERVLLFRLERVGDLLMARPAIAAVRRFLPDARIDLVVGGWNRELASLLPGIDHVHALDLPWLARGAGSATISDVRAAIGAWRKDRPDLAINFEGDIRSHALMWATGAARRVGFDMAGGGPLLTERVVYDPRAHVTANCLRLVARACNRPEADVVLEPAPLAIPEHLRIDALRRLGTMPATPDGRPRPFVGVHPSAGRLVKQWAPAAFSRAALELARRHQAVIVLTGSDEDRPVVEEVKAGLPQDVTVIDLTGQLDLVQLAAVLERMQLLLSVDTGPMHLAAAVGTPVVGVFGPSDPRRWGPLGPSAVSVRVDLPCSPCNRIRRPPARCVGHVPDCLATVTAEQVIAAAGNLLGMRDTGRVGHGSR